MKNRNFKKMLFVTFFLSFFFGVTLFLFNSYFIKSYRYNNDLLLQRVLVTIKEKDPSFDEEEIIALLNTKEVRKENTFLLSYGISLEKESVSLAGKKIINKMIILNCLLIILYFLLLFTFIFFFTRRENKKIKEITHYIKEINKGNYVLDISLNSEDDLSLLKNEIYKTAVTLNEQALLLKKEKETLKDSLSDISHQLKTPLTSITLMIERLHEEEKMAKEEKESILKDIHRKITHINFLVYSLLKLSKLDANTILFHDEVYKIEDILEEVKDNLSILCDLKDIEIRIIGNKRDTLYCDFKWQVEAITNIVKNCLEYSKEGSYIEILYESNELLTKISIKDRGIGMDKKECAHIFDRFYKGKNSSKDSVGIGLSLAKSIIEKEKGHIIVTSTIGKGTTFNIKYLK